MGARRRKNALDFIDLLGWALLCRSRSKRTLDGKRDSGVVSHRFGRCFTR